MDCWPFLQYHRYSRSTWVRYLHSVQPSDETLRIILALSYARQGNLNTRLDMDTNTEMTRWKALNCKFAWYQGRGKLKNLISRCTILPGDDSTVSKDLLLLPFEWLFFSPYTCSAQDQQFFSPCWMSTKRVVLIRYRDWENTLTNARRKGIFDCTENFVPSSEGLSGTCFKEGEQEEKLFTIHFSSYHLKHCHLSSYMTWLNSRYSLNKTLTFHSELKSHFVPAKSFQDLSSLAATDRTCWDA